MALGVLGQRDVRTVPVWIYALVESDTGEVRYIGKSSNPRNRLSNHMGDPVARRTYAWGQELRARGAKAEIILLRKVEPGEDADLAEREEIEKRRGLSDLLNVHGVVHRKYMLTAKRASCNHCTRRNDTTFRLNVGTTQGA